MNHPKLKIAGLLVSAAVLFTACKKDDENAVLPANEAKTALTDVNTDVSNDLTAVSTAKGFTALEDLSALTNSGVVIPFGQVTNSKNDSRAQVRKAIATLRSISEHTVQNNSRTQGDEPYNYNAHKGVYEWKVVAGQGSFVKTGSSTIVEIKFPTKGSSTNNADFRLTNYAEISIVDELGLTTYNPTIIEATLDIDGTKEASLSVAAEYPSGDDQPNKADVVYFVKPYTFELHTNDKSSDATSVSESLSNGNEVLIAWSINAAFDSQHPKGGQFPASLVGKLQLRKVTFTATITSPDANAKDYNDFIKIDVSVDGRAAGNVVWVTEVGASEPTPYVQYTDGSKQKLSELFAKLESSLSKLNAPLLNF